TLSNAAIANPRAYPSANTTYQVHIVESVCNVAADLSMAIQVDAPVVSISGDDEICLQGSTTLTAAGAGTYTWSPATGLNNPNSATPIASPASTTQYTVTGFTSNGCTDESTVTITVFPLPLITITPDTTICKNTLFQLAATGGVSYSWSPASTLNQSNISNPVASPGSQPTKYKVTVTDGNTCVNTDSVMIDILPDPVYSITPNRIICNEDSIRLVVAGGSVFQWAPSGSLSHPNNDTTWAYPSSTTTYQVMVSDAVCNTSNVLQTVITVNQLPDVRGTSSNDLDCSYGSSQLLATGAQRYTWSPSIGLSSTTIRNPIARPTQAMNYLVTGTDMNGCKNSDTVKIAMLNTNMNERLVPNAFTPDGDGINDCFGISYWGVIEKLDFSIYNRWGERLFHTNNPTSCWDGVYKGVRQDGAVFVYVISAVTNCGPVNRKGTFVLIR
ncbi:MAG: gliding motility-associated C-terminal domain-containing protein, partial [Cytophagaceae bacterium]